MWENFKEFWAEPFQQDMDAVRWFMFLGLIIVILVLWNIIFYHIKEAID